MKHIDLFCSSPASTAICSSMDPRAIVRPAGPRSIGAGVVGHSKRRPCSSNQLPIDPKTSNYLNKSSTRKSSASREHDDHTITPTGSSRYLLNESNRHRFFDLLNLHDSTDLHIKTIQKPKPKPKPDSPCAIRRTQVVELMVSIHCKGCEGKVRRHISKMEGVTSFNIDLDLKKVTIVGEVTPLQVLTSISRVKTAQFWPSSSSVC
ncbi:protein SODIUM POTASSIUM ROOT DEFECTIVE 2-like [Impatiens glandulifera]|uniref:protein SODIUM POTASSIUM ROOT DEFECTIVE 2-like n=1 Tax=Impatiens glandulifera TaxID=253017 RepID=UPI001FB15FB6|nr:protein SODIUM POTASSIUM ROOT DEFECTIVE 2-like [Impatiens glandulifera]